MPRIKRLRNSIQLYGWKSCRCINQSLTKWAPSRCSQTRSIESSPSPSLSRFSLEHDRSTIPAGETASPEERKSSDPVSRPRFKTSLPYQRRPRYRETLETTSIQHSNLLSTVVTFNPPSSPNFRPTNFSVLSLSFSFENRGNRKCDSISWLYYNRYYIEVRRKKLSSSRR